MDDYPYTPSVTLTGTAILAVFANGAGNAQFRLNRRGRPNEIAT